MAYGAYILMDSGQPFVTPESAPLTLVSKKSATSSISNATASASVSFTVDTSKPFIPFCVAVGGADHPVAFSSGLSGSTLTLKGASNMGNNTKNFTMDCYLFSTNERSSPNIDWGFCIWNAQGKVILTNEDRVLTDLSLIGTPGASNSGMGVSATLSGKWGVVPSACGGVVYHVDAGGPGGVNVPIPYGFGARYLSGQTKIHVASGAASPGGVAVSSYSGYNAATVVNLSNYD